MLGAVVRAAEGKTQDGETKGLELQFTIILFSAKRLHLLDLHR
jgi:hypothetical protein